jgi:hypothetical protein
MSLSSFVVAIFSGIPFCIYYGIYLVIVATPEYPFLLDAGKGSNT